MRKHSRQRVKVGVLSDTHGWIDPQVRRVLTGVDCIVHAGDVLGFSVLQQLENLTSPEQVIAVAGNNDITENWPGLEGKLPTVAEVPLPGGTLVVTHGNQFGSFPAHAELRQAWPEAKVVVYGHTHRMVCDQEGLPWIFNPGAAGRTRVNRGPSCLVLTAGFGDWTVSAHQFEGTSEA